jgi:ATP-dependent RNA helicase RhlE
MPFERLGLAATILRAVGERGYTEPTPIQRATIPTVLAGCDLMAGAQTGTGKTAGFALPILHNLSMQSKRGPRYVRCLVLAPTRELTAQVEQSFRDYGKYLPLRTCAVFGGVGIHPQMQKLARGVDILVATPGRLLDHLAQRTVDLSRVEILVLDEADRMLDMGFVHDVRRILKSMPQKRQSLLFSATFPNEIKRFAEGFLREPEFIEIARNDTTVKLISQCIHPVDKHRKRELLSWLIGTKNWRQVLVFTRTKRGADRLAQHLEKDGLKTAAIHGNKSQGARTRALANFKAGRVRVLVATDIAARGLDINQLPHVVNYELPNVPEDYVHRIGRTGRAGNEGEAISLVCGEEKKYLADIERLLGTKLPQEVLTGYESSSNTDIITVRDTFAPKHTPRGSRPATPDTARSYRGPRKTARRRTNATQR